MAKEDWSKKVGTIILAVMVVALGFVIYMVVSGQWGTKKFRGIEKFRGDAIEQVDPSSYYVFVDDTPDRSVA